MTEEEMQKKAKALQNAVASVRSRRDAIERELSKLERVAFFYSLGIDPAGGVKCHSPTHLSFKNRNQCEGCTERGTATLDVQIGDSLIDLYELNLCVRCFQYATLTELQEVEGAGFTHISKKVTRAAGSPVGEANNG